MTCLVTPAEARTIHAYFRAVRIVRDLSDTADVRQLNAPESRRLIENMSRVDELRGQVKTINERAFAA